MTISKCELVFFCLKLLSDYLFHIYLYGVQDISVGLALIAISASKKQVAPLPCQLRVAALTAQMLYHTVCSARPFTDVALTMMILPQSVVSEYK